MKKILVITFILINIAHSDQVSGNKWGNDILRNPEKYLLRENERYTFNKLILKFAPVRQVSIDKKESGGSLILGLINDKIRYRLDFDLDSNDKITYLYRNLDDLVFEGDAAHLQRVKKWLGQFFYRLDAIDSAGVRDLIFYKNILIRYGGESDKGKLISDRI